MLKQNINTYIATGIVFAVGVGASYIIIAFANGTDFSFVASISLDVVSGQLDLTLKMLLGR